MTPGTLRLNIYGDAESSMLDNSGELVDCDWTNLTIFDTADISGMQAETYTWDSFNEKVDAIASDLVSC